MGILYNRFTPGFTLLPYSDQSKIITYATYENFDATSSTWGTGIAPIQNNIGWYKDTDAQGFISFGSGYNRITNTSALGNAFTVYEVLKHVDYTVNPDTTYNLIINRGSQSANENLFSPYYNSTSYSYACHTSVGVMDVGNLSDLNQLHITATSYTYQQTGPKCSLHVYCNLGESHKWQVATSSASIEGLRIAGKNITTRCYKFIAVVAEDESLKYIGNYNAVNYNMDVLRAYFGVDYISPFH